MNSQFRWIAALAAVVLLHGCGGGGGGAQSGGTGGTGVVVVSSGVMTKGSVILNGVRYEDTAANIVIDDQPKTAASLQSGMVVKVKGSAKGANGTAERVEAQVEVRGAVTSTDAAANPQSFVVLGQTVLVDDQTIYSNLADFAEIVARTPPVEVHGLRDATGRVRATRIEGGLTDPGNGIFMADPLVDEIRGVVKNLSPGFPATPATFTLGSQIILVNTVNVITPVGATLANDIVVEVHCARGLSGCIVGNQFVATKVDVESAEDSAFEPAQNQKVEVEGLVTGFTLHPGDFFVAGVPVTTSTSTVFEGGVAGDLANDVEVEAEGVWVGNRLIASKIQFEREVIRLQGDPSPPSPTTGNTFTLQIAGLGPVTIEALDGVVRPLGSEPCVEVRGQRKSGATVVVTATQINLSCSNSSDHLIQAPVEAESGTILTLLGIPIDVVNPTDNPPYQNIDGSPMTSTAFFNAVVPANPGPPAVAGTLVKVRFVTPGVAVKQVELED